MTAPADRFATARAVADAVLDEGHVLYPYRASAMKNRMRWQFGILGPPAHEGRPGAEATWCRTVVAARAPLGTGLVVVVRWLQPAPAIPGEWQDATMAEAVLHTEVGAPAVDHAEGGVGLRVTTEPADDGWCTVEVVVRNVDETAVPADADRAAVLARSRVGVHTMLGLDGGRFVSSVAPPAEAPTRADPGGNVRTWPVLVGADTMLSCPVILYDQPELAPEVDARGCDALEIEELLALRVATLTPAERAEAAATDPVAAALVARHAQLDADDQWLLHGRQVMAPASTRPPVPAPGASVRLRPKRQADAQDMFLAGRVATVVAHETDVEGHVMVRVTLDDDPGRDLQEWHGRSWFFGIDEVEPA